MTDTFLAWTFDRQVPSLACLLISVPSFFAPFHVKYVSIVAQALHGDNKNEV